MSLSHADLAWIDERASSLPERLAGDFVATADGDASAALRLSRWRHLAAESWPQQFAALLGLPNVVQLPEPQLLALLGPVKRTENSPRPGWVSLLNEIVDGIAQHFSSTNHDRNASVDSRRKREGIPYEDLFWPIAEIAWNRILSQGFIVGSPVEERARQGLQKYLVWRISGIASSILHPAFLANKGFAESGMMQHFFNAAGEEGSEGNGTRHYTTFIAEQGENGLRPLFMRFPVAARLVAEVTQSWIEFVGEFLHRLRADREQLSGHFNAGALIGPLIGVKAGVSDPHRGGRSVLILTFRGGLQIVYKPRPMAIDLAFYGLVTEINARNSALDLGTLKICDQGEYGWMEFARHSPCPDRPAARRYYQRAGALACLTHWLQGIDFHRENVVAAGEQPLLVDLECLAHPLRPEEYTTANAYGPSSLARSVLRTGLLPMWQTRAGGGPPYDNCGFNGPIRQRSFFPVKRWENINTNRMEQIVQRRYQHHANHRPTIGRRALSIRAFAASVLDGYRRMQAILGGSESSLYLGLREKVYSSAARRIKRPTFIYGMLLQRSLEPVTLRYGVDRSIESTALPCDSGEEGDWTNEITSLEKLDIPYFEYAQGCKVPDPPDHTDQTRNMRRSVNRKIWLYEGRLNGSSTTAENLAQMRGNVTSPAT